MSLEAELPDFKSKLADAFKKGKAAAKKEGATEDEVIKTVCDAIGDEVIKFRKSATIMIPSGGVVTAGSQFTQTNPAPVTEFEIT